MQIEVKGRNFPITDELREICATRFKKIDKQVSELAVLEIELSEEHNPAIANDQIAEATLYLKGVTLRAKDTSPNMSSSITLIAEEMARQVKRYRDKRRGRREARSFAHQPYVEVESGQMAHPS